MPKIKKRRDWVQEAREQLANERQYLRSIERYIRKDGTREPDKSFHMRKDRARARVKNRERVLDILKRKLDAAIERREDRQDDKPPFDKGSTDIVTFDGKPVVEDAAFWLWKSREAGWDGILVSGFRTPEHSEQLCFNMCGAPSCPGLCAGRSSNHTKRTFPGPAVDVSEFTQFEQIQFQIGSPYRNDLPLDAVHFSLSGR